MNFIKWFNKNIGWFFVNGRKQEIYAENIRKKYSEYSVDNENDSMCQTAHKIVNERNEEKDRMYGPFSEGMDRAAAIFTNSTGIEIDGSHMFIAMISLKLSRESYNHKSDNILDAIAYLQGLENYHNNKAVNKKKK